MLKNLVLLRTLRDASGRREARAERLYEAARGDFARGDYSAAERLLRRALYVFPRPHMSALLARTLLCQGDTARALKRAALTARIKTLAPADIEHCARVFAACGEAARARKLLARLTAEKPMSPGARRHLIGGLCALSADQALRPLLSMALIDTPYDPELLHICAVNRLRERHLPEQAAGYWSRMLRIDPDDDVARYYLGLYAKEALPKNISYEYALPEAERARRIKRLKEAQILDECALRGPEYPALCRYGLRCGDKTAAVLSLNLLPRLESPARRVLQKEAEYAPANLSLARGVNLRWPAVSESVAATAFCETEEAIRVPPILRRAMRLATLLATPEYGDLSAEIIRLVVTRLAQTKPLPRVKDAPCAAAAIVLCVLKRAKRPARAQHIARLFGCGERRARKNAKILFGFEEGETHEAD